MASAVRKLPTSRRSRKAATAAALATELRMIQEIADSEDKWMKRLDETANRFETVTAELRASGDADHKYLNERIDTVETNLSTKIDKHTAKIQEHFDESVNRLGDRLEQRIGDIDGRVDMLEKWRWLIVGGAAVVFFIVTEYLINYFQIRVTGK